MSKRKRNSGPFWFKLLSILLSILSLVGLLGAFGYSIGERVYTFLTMIFGKSLTLVGLALCLISAFLLWIYSWIFMTDRSVRSSSSKLSRTSGKRRKTRSSQLESDQPPKPEFQPAIDSHGISLPPGKLVTIKGFNQYFSSPEWVELKDVDNEMAEEMKEIGNDFSSYFGIGESVFSRSRKKMSSLYGLKDYFEEVDHEERLERTDSIQDSSSCREKTRSIEKPLFSSIFESKKDQEEFLAQFKEDKIPHDFKSDDVIEDLGVYNLKTPEETPEDITETEKITPTLKCSVLSSEKTKILVTEEKPEECGQETGVESSDKSAPDTVLKTKDSFYSKDTLQSGSFNYAGQVAPLVKLAIERAGHWKIPNYDLLDPIPQRIINEDTETLKQLEKMLLDFGVKAKVIGITRGPVITRYELAPAPGVKISKIVNLSDDIALGLAAQDVRIEAPIPGKAAIGIEVPNKQPRSVPFREVLETANFEQYPSKLKVALGKDIADQAIIADLVKMPHLLVAGATGSGKSVCITTIINSILYNAAPDEVKFLLVDPKMVELNQYNGIPHLLAPVVVDPKKAASALKWIVKEMENRYELFAAAGVRDIERYNKLKAAETTRTAPALSFIVVIIDELADLMVVAAGEVEEAICRLAQMARAAGIHLVIATQRPSVDVITGVIKANIPSRISFAVSSQIDSRTILDANGAEKLLGRGDMLYSPLGVNKPLRVQGCLVTDDEVQRVIMYWKKQGKPEYLDPELFVETPLKNEESNGSDDALFIEAGQLFIRTGMASVSFLQRRLKLGYTRAARLMDMLEEQGIVGAYEGSKPRQVLLTLEEFNERFR